MKIKKATTQRLLNKYSQLVNDGKSDHRLSHLIGAIRRRPDISYQNIRTFKECTKPFKYGKEGGE